MNIFKFPFSVDVQPIKGEITVNAWAWDYNNARAAIYEQRDTKTIPLRNSKIQMGIAFRDSHVVADTGIRYMFPAVNSVLDYFIAQYGGDLGRVSIVQLPPEKTVALHIDEGDYYRQRDRFHLVIDGMYEYEVDGEREVFSEGDLFWFDSQKPHRTLCIGSKPRITVIFDVKGSEFRQRLNLNV